MEVTKLLRVYDPSECNPQTGYPLAWDCCPDCKGYGWIATATGEGHPPGICGDPLPPGELGGTCCDDLMGCRSCETAGSVKHMVRQQAGHRCIRCRHPFVVGESGIMEGPQAQTKAFAADLGVDAETLDTVIFESMSRDVQVAMLSRSRRVNWSNCDGKCRHGGPYRWRLFGVSDWLTYEGEEPPTEKNGLYFGETGEAQASWRILTVHHLDEVKANLRWWNLVALCQRCHLEIQGKVTMTRPWPYEHTPWFKPYAAAWYALKYLGQELSREETIDRLDMLLKLGQQEEGVERMAI